MSFFKITLHRSFIGMPKRTRAVLAALGLHRRGQLVFQPVSADIAGMIMKVKELVKVEEVDRALTKHEVHAQRQPDPGFWIESFGASRRAADALVAGAGTGTAGEGAGKVEEGKVRL